MKYITGLSPKGLLIGLLVGYILPLIIFKGLAWLAYSYNEESIFISAPVGLSVLVVAIIAFPFIGGYMSAKYSKEYPITNAVATSIVGIVLISTLGEIHSFLFYGIGVSLVLFSGYLGGKRFNVNG